MPGLAAGESSGDGLEASDCLDSPALLLAPPQSPSLRWPGQAALADPTCAVMDVDGEVASCVWTDWGREMPTVCGTVGSDVANGRAGKEVGARADADAEEGGDGAVAQQRAERFVAYAEVHMGIAADELKQTALRRISELYALLHAFRDAGVVRMSMVALDGGAGACGGCSAETADMIGAAPRRENGRERHGISVREGDGMGCCMWLSIFGFSCLYVDDVSQFNKGVREMVVRDKNKCWHANGRPTIQKPTGIVYELFRQVRMRGGPGVVLQVESWLATVRGCSGALCTSMKSVGGCNFSLAKVGGA